jgi:uncharacterized SAM-binding protein YcdF (DUF218 family)
VFFFLSKLLDVLLSPYTWGLLAFALVVPWRGPLRPRAWRRRRGIGIVGLLVLFFFGWDPVSNWLLYRLEHATTSTYRPDTTYDAVILLGGVSDERVLAEQGQSAYNENVERLIATHKLLASGHARTAIVSGAAMAGAPPEFGEARALANQIEEWGIEPSRILLEERARNTYENALYSKQIAAERGFTSVLVVTSAFHMRRSVECFEAVGMKVDTMLVDYRATKHSEALLPRAHYLSQSTMVLREMAGLYIYRLRGYAKPRHDAR